MAMSYSYDIQAKVFDRMKVDHPTIMALVYTWQARMEEFGAVVFKPWHDRGKLALLNEQQAIFLLGKMRKTYFKRRLIKAFGDFKWQNQQTLAATQLAAEQAEAAVVVNAACPPKPKQAKPKQAESASRSGFNLKSVDGEPSVGGNPLPHVGAISLVGNGGNGPTMSSLEIAKLTGKEHANVLKDIRKILNEVGIDEVKFHAIYLDDMNREQPCFNLPRRECDLVIAGYSAKYRLAIIDRWQELEQKVAQPQFAIPQTYHEALRLSADLAEKNAVITGQLAIASEQLAITAPKAKALDRFSDAKGMFNLNNAAKILGQPPIAFNTWLRDVLGWMKYNADMKHVPYVKTINAGYMDVIGVTGYDKNGNDEGSDLKSNQVDGRKEGAHLKRDHE